MKPVLRFVPLGVLVLLLLGITMACAGKEATPTPTSVPATPLFATPTPTVIAPPTPTAPAVRPRGTVTIASVDFGRENLDPSLGPGAGYNGPMFDWYVQAEPTGEISARYGVLESWKANADATVYTLILKKGIKWHDGVDMTSEDVKWSLEYESRPEAVCSFCGALKAGLDRVGIVDRYTVEVYLKKPDVIFPETIASREADLRILPKHHFAKTGIEGGFQDNPLGSGPFRLVSRRIGEYIEYEANEDYWNKERIPGFARLRMVMVPESGTRVAMLKTGEVDLIPLDPADVKSVREAGFKIQGPQNQGYNFIKYDRSWDPAFLTNKVEFRKALALAIDWDAIAEAFWPPEVATKYPSGTAFFSPVTMGYDPTLPPYPYDPEESRRLLKKVGYAGATFPFYNNCGAVAPEMCQVNEVVASYWRAVGVKVSIIPIAGATYRSMNMTNPPAFDPPGVAFNQAAQSRPSVLGNIRAHMISRKAGGTLQSYWDLEKIDRYFLEATAIVDPVKRDQRLREINRELYEEYWAIGVSVRHWPHGLGPRIADWQPTNGTYGNLAWDTLKPAS